MQSELGIFLLFPLCSGGGGGREDILLVGMYNTYVLVLLPPQLGSGTQLFQYSNL